MKCMTALMGIRGMIPLLFVAISVQGQQSSNEKVSGQHELTSQLNPEATSGILRSATESSLTSVNMKGAVELEVSVGSDYLGESTNDLTLATVTWGAEGKVSAHNRVGVSLLYEEGSTPLEVDEAFIEHNFSDQVVLKMGQQYLPFGRYKSHFVSDPLTLELGETRDVRLGLAYTSGPFSFSADVSKGSTQSNAAGAEPINTYILSAGWEQALANGSYGIHVAYNSNLFNSEGLREYAYDSETDTFLLSELISGYATTLYLAYGPMGLSFDYVGAASRTNVSSNILWQSNGALPAAMGAEISYKVDFAKRSGSIHAGIQASQEALFKTLPAQRSLVGIAFIEEEAFRWNLEWRNDTDYAVNECTTGVTCGSGKTSQNLVLQLGIDF